MGQHRTKGLVPAWDTSQLRAGLIIIPSPPPLCSLPPPGRCWQISSLSVTTVSELRTDKGIPAEEGLTGRAVISLETGPDLSPDNNPLLSHIPHPPAAAAGQLAGPGHHQLIYSSLTTNKWSLALIRGEGTNTTLMRSQQRDVSTVINKNLFH